MEDVVQSLVGRDVVSRCWNMWWEWGDAMGRRGGTRDAVWSPPGCCVDASPGRSVDTSGSGADASETRCRRLRDAVSTPAGRDVDASGTGVDASGT